MNFGGSADLTQLTRGAQVQLKVTFPGADEGWPGPPLATAHGQAKIQSTAIRQPGKWGSASAI